MSDTEALIQQANDLQDEAAASLAKPSVANLKAAVDLLKAVKRMRNEVAEAFDDVISKAKASYDTARDRKKKYDLPLDRAEETIKTKVSEYYLWEGKVQAADYRERVNDATNTAESERNSEIKMLEASGQVAEAAYLKEQPLDIMPVPKPEPTKVEGVSVQERWSAEVFDEGALWKFCNDNPEYRHFFKLHLPELNKLATSMKESYKIPGSKAVKKRVVTCKV